MIDLGTLPEWLAAIGTIGATALALYFGLRGRGETLTIGLSIDGRRLAFYVVNSSERPVFLQKLELELGRWKSADVDADLAMIFTRQTQAPVLVEPHGQRTFEIDLGDDSSYLPARIERAWRNRLRIDRRLYFVVTSGERARFRRRIPKALMGEILSQGSRAND